MSTEKERPGKGLYVLPLLMALPVIAAAALAMARFWPMIRKLLTILVKVVVKG